ncbi:MAG TPA: hypothetical protein DHM90_13315 [Clostridiaceae bacterium]|nr:hypothetical protein [Clostridiaceae bacterium]
MDTMRAMVIKMFGEPDVFQEVTTDIPDPLEDEILVKVHAVSFNPADASSRSGKFGKIINLDEPRILGLDVSGTVAAVGMKARKFQKNDRIYAYLDIRRNGSYAEYVTLKEEDADLMPLNLSYAEAAAVPLAALTAIQGVYELGELRENESILINGATGGVGLMAVQLAKLKNAKITAVCSDESKSLLEPFDVDTIIDYKNEDLLEVLNHKVDVFYNLAPLRDDKMRSFFALVKDKGRFVSTLGVPEDIKEENRRIRIISQQAKRGGERLKVISDLLSQEKVKPVVTSTWSFNDIPKVHTLHEEGKLQGKAVIILVETK